MSITCSAWHRSMTSEELTLIPASCSTRVNFTTWVRICSTGWRRTVRPCSALESGSAASADRPALEILGHRNRFLQLFAGQFFLIAAVLQDTAQGGFYDIGVHLFDPEGQQCIGPIDGFRHPRALVIVLLAQQFHELADLPGQLLLDAGNRRGDNGL